MILTLNDNEDFTFLAFSFELSTNDFFGIVKLAFSTTGRWGGNVGEGGSTVVIIFWSVCKVGLLNWLKLVDPIYLMSTRGSLLEILDI